MEEPTPASFSTTTSWPWATNSLTPDGVMATRYSWSLTSRGTPTRTTDSFDGPGFRAADDDGSGRDGVAVPGGLLCAAPP